MKKQYLPNTNTPSRPQTGHLPGMPDVIRGRPAPLPACRWHAGSSGGAAATSLRIIGLLAAAVALAGFSRAADSGSLLRYHFPPEKIVKRTVGADVCVYGGNAAGVAAAVAVARGTHRRHR
jgi:hypothetical protein